MQTQTHESVAGQGDWVVHLFTAINVFVALAYVLLAFFFARRLKLPQSGKNPLSVLACVGAMFFFVGCAHTHLYIAYWSNEGDLKAHWFTWWNIVSHTLQSLGGLTFWVLATFFLQVNIFDKRHYDQTIANHLDPPQEGPRNRQGSVDNA